MYTNNWPVAKMITEWNFGQLHGTNTVHGILNHFGAYIVPQSRSGCISVDPTINIEECILQIDCCAPNDGSTSASAPQGAWRQCSLGDKTR